mmetsp:Transcript_45184/g.105648  ORF Transcript_45184/g.105648 Transcript_45184/m.105648 type:complete len:224 (+) Transcript_45184:255-926(+)
MHSVCIRDIEKPFLQEFGCSVGDDAITLHLSKSQAAFFGTAFCWLSHQCLHWPSGSRLDLVAHHVLQALVVHRPDEDLVCEWTSSVSIPDLFVSEALEAHVMQPARDVLHRHAGEGRGIPLAANQSANLSGELLDQVANCHPRWNGMRVHDDVRRDPEVGERQVLLTVHDAQRSFLTVAGRKLVSNLRNFQSPEANFRELVPILVQADHDLVHNATLCRSTKN